VAEVEPPQEERGRDSEVGTIPIGWIGSHRPINLTARISTQNHSHTDGGREAAGNSPGARLRPLSPSRQDPSNRSGLLARGQDHVDRGASDRPIAKPSQYVVPAVRISPSYPGLISGERCRSMCQRNWHRLFLNRGATVWRPAHRSSLERSARRRRRCSSGHVRSARGPASTG
jgi:hypothetical protein